MTDEAEVIANMVRPYMARSGRMAVVLVIDVPTGDGPYVLSHEVATLVPDETSVWPLARVAYDWGKALLDQVSHGDAESSGPG